MRNVLLGALLQGKHFGGRFLKEHSIVVLAKLCSIHIELNPQKKFCFSYKYQIPTTLLIMTFSMSRPLSRRVSVFGGIKGGKRQTNDISITLFTEKKGLYLAPP